MLLVMDVGNTNIVIGLYDGALLQQHWRITSVERTGDELRVMLLMLMQSAGLQPKDISGCCVSSVAPQLNIPIQAACRDAFNLTPIMVGPGVKTGLILQCENPKEVGADRIVNAVGALDRYPGNLILIDFGTATTFDAVTEKAQWQGGVIVPGIQLAADALFERCAKLPRVDITVPEQVIGRNTVTNIQSGLTYGYADLVDGLIRRMADEMGVKPRVVATGGLASLVADLAQGIDHVDHNLTLHGLYLIYEKNRKQSECA